MANDFSGDAHLIALYNCENGALGTDSSGNGETLTVLSVTADTTNYRQGSGSALANNTLDQMSRSNGALGPDFPGKSGSSNRTFTVCGWVRPTNLQALNYITCIYDSIQERRSWAVSINSDDTMDITIGYNNGESFELLNHAGKTFVNNSWYHIGCTYDGTSKAWRIRVYDYTAQTVTEATGTGSQVMNIEAATFTLFARADAALGMVGNIDELVIFDDVKTANEIDQIRAGTYGVGTTTTTATASTTSSTTSSTTTTATASTTSSTTTTSSSTSSTASTTSSTTTTSSSTSSTASTTSSTSSTTSTTSSTSSTSSTASTSSTSSTASTTSSTSSTASTSSTTTSSSTSSTTSTSSTSSSTSTTTTSSTTTTAAIFLDSEVWHNYTTGKTLYFCRFTVNGNVFLSNGSSDEKWGTGGRDASDYAVSMSEATVSGHYVAPFDEDGNMAEGTYRIGIFDQRGANPANSDNPAIAQGEIYWDGTQELTPFITLSTISDPVVVEDETEPIVVEPDTGAPLPGGGAGSAPGGGAEGGGGSSSGVGGPSGC